MKKHSRNNLIKVISALIISAFALSLIACGEGPTMKVMCIIDGPDGISQFEKEIEVPEGARVFETLKPTGLSFEWDGTYVHSIGTLSETDVSGWMYEVNGDTVWESANNVTLNAGDTVHWIYFLAE